MKRAAGSAVARFLFSAALAAIVLGAVAPPEQLLLDLVGDGKPDVVMLQVRGDSVVVSVRFADRRLSPERFRFVVGADEDDVCQLPVHLRTESSTRGMGFRLDDGACDSIHFSWDHRTKRLVWWRL